MKFHTNKSLVCRLRRGCAALNKVLADAKTIYPNATFYLDGTNNLHLIDGPSHDERHSPRQEFIIGSGHLKSDGGDW